MPSSATGSGREPGSALITDGASSHGAAAAAWANFEENSPNARCWLRCSISPNVAMSQNAVAPPLPSTTSWPSGSENSSASPCRTRPTVSRTGAWRCEVPIRLEPVAASASRWLVWIFEGPAPKRPSAGRSAAGICRASVMTTFRTEGQSGGAGRGRHYLTTLSAPLFCQHP